MKKLVLNILVVLILLSSGMACWASEKPIVFQVDGNNVSFNESTGFPYMTDTGRTMMPFRVCLNAIGCEVDWDQKTETAISRKGATQVEIPIGKKEIYKNQTSIETDTAAVIKNGRTYVPLRAVLEVYGYTLVWEQNSRTVSATKNNAPVENIDSLTPLTINGGTTGIFSRKQLQFEGFDGIQAQVTLPTVTIAEKGDCPYVYFGFDWKEDKGNVEGGFQFIEDPNHKFYNQWTVFMRQGNDWNWGNNIALAQGSTHHIKFYREKGAGTLVDLIIELDGKEIIRKSSATTDFQKSSVKAVVAMAMSKPFDGSNCFSKSENCKVSNLTVSMENSPEYKKMEEFITYKEWRPKKDGSGMWFGTVDCVPSYLHKSPDGSISIYKDALK